MVNKRLFEVSQEEKNRILGLHESATKKLYILKEQNGIEFSFPPLRIGGYQQKSALLGMRGIYDVTKGLFFTWGGKGIFEVPNMTDLNSNPNWIITPKNGTTPFDEWVRELNSDFLNDNGPSYYIPTYDKNRMEATWIAFRIYSKRKRSKKGIGALIGLGKRYTQYYIQIVDTIPTGYIIPKT